MILKQYLIPGVARSKKNSQQIIHVKGRAIPIPSKAYKEFEVRCGDYMTDKPDKPIDTPVQVTCLFYIPLNKDGTEPKKQLDLCNLLGAVDDILVTHSILADDDNRIVKSHDGSRVRYTDTDPRTIIIISEYEEVKI